MLKENLEGRSIIDEYSVKNKFQPATRNKLVKVIITILMNDNKKLQNRHFEKLALNIQ